MDFKSIIRTVAPWIGTALGGPLGGLAVEAAANALGVSEKTMDAVKTAITGATPEQLLALKQADHQFQLQMQELGFKNITDLERIAAEDRASARAMQMTVRSPVPAVLTLAVVIGYFGILVGSMAGWLSVVESEALLLMIGNLGTAFGMVLAYWFGTTSNSFRKTEMIHESTPTGGNQSLDTANRAR